MKLQDLTGRNKMNRGFSLIMSTLKHFTEQQQDQMLQDLKEELEDQRARARQQQEIPLTNDPPDYGI